MKTTTLIHAMTTGLLGLGTLTLYAGSYAGPTGLQFYSLRADFAKDVPGALKFVKSLGFKEGGLAAPELARLRRGDQGPSVPMKVRHEVDREYESGKRLNDADRDDAGSGGRRAK